MRKVLFGICLIVYSLFGSTDVSARDVISFNGGWEFKKGPFGISFNSQPEPQV